jgi:hypothetical protein
VVPVVTTTSAAVVNLSGDEVADWGEWGGVGYGLINYVDTKANCLHLKILT